MKTNAARVLDSLKVQYELREYEVDPEHLEAESVALKVGLPPEQVFKTLVARGDRNGVCFAVIPANTELNLKALASASGDRKIEMVPLKEVQLEIGGRSARDHRNLKAFRCFAAQNAFTPPRLYISLYHATLLQHRPHYRRGYRHRTGPGRAFS